jgi:hypothetical protein
MSVVHQAAAPTGRKRIAQGKASSAAALGHDAQNIPGPERAKETASPKLSPVEFLGIWEPVHNPKFNSGELAIIKSQAGLNSYKLSVKEWVEKTNAIGLKASAGRYGGTFEPDRHPPDANPHRRHRLAPARTTEGPQRLIHDPSAFSL